MEVITLKSINGGIFFLNVRIFGKSEFGDFKNKQSSDRNPTPVSLDGDSVREIRKGALTGYQLQRLMEKVARCGAALLPFCQGHLLPSVLQVTPSPPLLLEYHGHLPAVLTFPQCKPLPQGQPRSCLTSGSRLLPTRPHPTSELRGTQRSRAGFRPTSPGT